MTPWRVRLLGMLRPALRSLGVAGALAACAAPQQPETPPGIAFGAVPALPAEQAFRNWPLKPHELEGQISAALAAGDYEVLEDRPTARGMGGARKLTLYFPHLDREIGFKWKLAPQGYMDGFNNSPRREIAAYRIQRLFLDPEHYVVPNSFLHCMPLARHEVFHGPSRPNPAASACVLGNLSLWLQDVTVPEVFYEEARFLSEPRYAHAYANLNLLTYLIEHRDAREGNFLISGVGTRPVVFSVDNGEAFGHFPYNFFVRNWDVIRVPALRRESLERLRRLRRADLDVLGVVGHMEADAEGVLVAAPAPGNLDPERGVRLKGTTVQYGLTTAEIDDVWRRIADLLAAVDRGEIPLF